MQVLSGFKFFDKETTPISSNILYNTNGSLLVLQVSGDANSFSFSIYGKVNAEADEYVRLQAINIEDFSLTNSISTNGIYNVSIDGISSLYIELESVDDEITVYGKVGA